jgi:hypothetical protein
LELKANNIKEIPSKLKSNPKFLSSANRDYSKACGRIQIATRFPLRLGRVRLPKLKCRRMARSASGASSARSIAAPWSIPIPYGRKFEARSSSASQRRSTARSRSRTAVSSKPTSTPGQALGCHPADSGNGSQQQHHVLTATGESARRSRNNGRLEEKSLLVHDPA